MFYKKNGILFEFHFLKFYEVFINFFLNHHPTGTSTNSNHPEGNFVRAYPSESTFNLVSQQIFLHLKNRLKVFPFGFVFAHTNDKFLASSKETLLLG